MNGFAQHGPDAGNFHEKDSVGGEGLGGGLRTFDAFPKTKTTYTTRHARGGQWTVILLLTCALLSLSELRTWHRGHETRQFSVEKGVGHVLQINLDVVVAMPCHDLHVHVQDASGDLIRAGDTLREDDTSWSQWRGQRGMHTLGAHGDWDDEMDEEDHVAEVMAHVGGWKGYSKTPRPKGDGGACRIYGSMELNKVQGDFHITARGHGYVDWEEHLDHGAFNFSHVINELSFGPFYPSLHNPLDNTVATTPSHFYKFQYYLSIVPTIYTTSSSASLSPLSSSFPGYSRDGKTVFTNQYAVTSQSRMIGERSIPGIFFKFDIEPILLLIRDERTGLLRLLIRLVNVVSGVLVAGAWCYSLGDWVGESLKVRRRRGGGDGVLHGRTEDE